MSRESTTLDRVSPQKVKAATGKSWAEWLTILDEQSANKLPHKEIALLLHRLGVVDWWAQMIAVGYEQARGLRVPHQKPEGFEISVTLTVNAPLPLVESSFTDQSLRRQWLPEVESFRKHTTGKNLRFNFGGDSLVAVNFYAKGLEKCQVSLQHSKLSDEKKAGELKGLWKEKLAVLAALVEKQ